MTDARGVARGTVRTPTTLSGRGLFTGAPATLRFTPAPAGTGIILQRTDLSGAAPIPATAAHAITDPRLVGRNTIVGGPGDGNVAVTVEHLLSALAASMITDVVVELSGPEVPILDGSSAPLCQAIDGAGVAPLVGLREDLVITRVIDVRDERGGFARAEPFDGTRYEYTLDYGPGACGALVRGTASVDLGGPAYRTDVAPARTFCLKAEAEAMRAQGMFTGMSERDFLVLDERGEPLNNALRFPDEPARHKLLDLIGDLMLVGTRIRGRIVAERSGHALNRRLASAILAG